MTSPPIEADRNFVRGLRGLLTRHREHQLDQSAQAFCSHVPDHRSGNRYYHRWSGWLGQLDSVRACQAKALVRD